MRTLESPYMNWAKLESGARFNLATSGVPNVLMRDFPFEREDLELTYGVYGYEPLIDALAARSGVESANVVLAFGTSMANHLALAALLAPGDEVLIEKPVYELIVSAARYLGARVEFFERRHEDAYRLDAAAIEGKITDKTKLVVLTNLHNPSSVAADEETLRAIGALAARRGARVLVDEVYLETMFDAAPPSSFHLGENFVVTSSLTKTYGLSGLRCGWILADPATAEKMNRLNDLFAAGNVHVAERLSLVALKNLDLFRERARRLLDANRPLVNDFLDSRADLDAVRPQYGTTVFPRLLKPDAEGFFRLLREKYETTVVPGRFFDAPDHFRLGLTCDTATLRAGLERLGAALDEIG
ncbi:MAG: pyridoxal phosphate-dependent aminotransferase [Acidobacteria bacterium]|nr:pyridoxal phosphate-dependent aminotransferase [Acidobacteriota bacterium]